MMEKDNAALVRIREQIAAAVQGGHKLSIRGAGTKDFYGQEPIGEPLEIGAYCGIISYEPTELIVVDGETRFEEIPGTVLRFVKNTDSDLFVLADRYYLLVSGRWFVTKSLLTPL